MQAEAAAEGESNTLTATALFGAAVVVDAFTSLDRSGAAESAATSMRATCVVLVACLAGPPIREWMLLEQRAVIGVLLAIVALVGRHEAGSDMRMGDAVYVALLYVATLWMFWVGGTESTDKGRVVRPRSRDAPPFVHRESLMNLAVASLLYVSLRLVRHGFEQPLAISSYAHPSTGYDGTVRQLKGYAYSSSLGTCSLVFGGAVGVGTSVALFVDARLREQGTAAATLLLTVSATAQLTAAFLTTLSQSEALQNLPAIWSEAACDDRALCPVAFEARRLSLVSQSPSALWINALGTFVLAYAPSMRFQSRAAMLGSRRNFEMFIYGLIAASVAVAALLNYLSFSGTEALTDYALVGATVSVFLTAFVDSLAGALSFVICLLADVATDWASDGAAGVFLHPSRAFELYIVVLLLVYTLLGIFVEVTWRWLAREFVDAADRVLGILVVAGTSAATVLYLGAAASLATYDGQLLDETHLRGPDRRFARTSAASIVEHWLPLLVWLPLYGCRCEVEFLSVRTRAIAWYGSALVPVLMWAVALLALEAAPTASVGWLDSAPYILGLFVVALVPWMGLVWA